MKIAHSILALLLASVAGAQTLEMRPTKELHLIGGPVVAIIFEVPAGLTVTAGASLAAAGKNLTCSVVTNLCIIIGLNKTVMAGHIATISDFGLPTDVRGVDEEAVSSFAILVVQIFSPCDLNQDGPIDALDLLHIVTKILDGTACGLADLDGDGVCTVVDSQRVANAAVTGVCVEG